MFASSRHLAARTALLLAMVSGSSAYAQDVTFSLTEAPEPDSKAWEEPARISFTIDNDGPDTFSGQINAEAKKLLNPAADRFWYLGGNLVWNRESGGEDRQNNFEAGLVLKADFSTAGTDAPSGGGGPGKPGFQVAPRFAVGYSRTASYADKTAAPCVAAPALRQCSTQFSEGLRGGAVFSLFGPGFENWSSGKLAYSISPKVGVEGDILLNNPVDTETGLTEKGGFVSAKAGIALALAPRFIAPAWDLRASFETRQRLAVSNSRRNATKRNSTLFEAGLTYYVINPLAESDGGWRAGIGLKYSRGSDPFVGLGKVDQIVLSLRIGQY